MSVVGHSSSHAAISITVFSVRSVHKHELQLGVDVSQESITLALVWCTPSCSSKDWTTTKGEQIPIQVEPTLASSIARKPKRSGRYRPNQAGVEQLIGGMMRTRVSGRQATRQWSSSTWAVICWLANSRILSSRTLVQTSKIKFSKTNECGRCQSSKAGIKDGLLCTVNKLNITAREALGNDGLSKMAINVWWAKEKIGHNHKRL